MFETHKSTSTGLPKRRRRTYQNHHQPSKFMSTKAQSTPLRGFFGGTRRKGPVQQRRRWRRDIGFQTSQLTWLVASRLLGFNFWLKIPIVLPQVLPRESQLQLTAEQVTKHPDGPAWRRSAAHFPSDQRNDHRGGDANANVLTSGGQPNKFFGGKMFKGHCLGHRI